MGGQLDKKIHCLRKSTASCECDCFSFNCILSLRKLKKPHRSYVPSYLATAPAYSLSIRAIKRLYLFIYNLNYIQLVRSLISQVYKPKIQQKHTMVQNYDDMAVSQLGNSQLEKMKQRMFTKAFHSA